MRLSRTDLIPVLAIVAGGAVGVATSASLVLSSRSDYAPVAVAEADMIEFKLVLPTTDVLASLEDIDRAIVQTLGSDSIRAMGRDVMIPTPGDYRDDVLDILGRTLSGATTNTRASVSNRAQATEEALRPFSSLLFGSDVEGTFLVSVKDVPAAQYFLSLPEVQQRLPRDQALHWGAELVPRGRVNYQRLWMLTDEPFLTGDELGSATAVFDQSQVKFELSQGGGGSVAIVADGDVISVLVIQSDYVSAPVRAIGSPEGTGTWVLSVDLGVSGGGDATFVFDQQGSAITGTYRGLWGFGIEVRGTVVDGMVKFSFQADRGRVAYEGTIVGNTMEGRCVYGSLAPGTFAGRRRG